MKQILLISSLLFSVITHAQFNWEYGFGLTHQIPQGSMANNINPANGFNFELGYRLPILKNKLVASLDFGNGRYGKKRVEQTFQSDVITTPTNFMVNYINFVNYTHLNLRYELVKNKMLIPYVQLKGGRQTLGTRVRINEFEESFGGDGCAPLEDEVTFRKRTMLWGYGAGFLLKIASQKHSHIDDSNILLNFSVSQVIGGNIDYINVKQLEQLTANPNPGDDSKAFTVPFININTNNIHNHTVARVYNSPLQQLQFKLGLIFRLEN